MSVCRYMSQGWCLCIPEVSPGSARGKEAPFVKLLEHSYRVTIAMGRRDFPVPDVYKVSVR